jgi:ABC-2 type transport system ATP-binding protein
MDPMMKRRVLDRIRHEAQQGKTIILTTQILEEAEELCDRILIINNGTLLASGTLGELRKLSSHMFRVSLTFQEAREDLHALLSTLEPASLSVQGDTAEMLFKGEESALLGQLARIAEVTTIRNFEARAVGLEDIFVELVGAQPGKQLEAHS